MSSNDVQYESRGIKISSLPQVYEITQDSLFIISQPDNNKFTSKKIKYNDIYAKISEGIQTNIENNIEVNITNIQTDITNIQTDITNIENNITNVQTDISSIKNRVSTLENKLSKLKLVTLNYETGIQGDFIPHNPESKLYLGENLKFIVKDAVSKRGYDFTGWKINNKIYQPKESIYLYETTTAIAQFNQQETNTITLTYDIDGGSGIFDSQSITVLKGESAEFKLYSHIPTKIDPSGTYTYEFQGWKINNDIYSPGSTITLTSSTTATAVWTSKINTFTITYHSNYPSKPIKTITLSFNGNGGTDVPEPIPANVIDGNSYTFTIPNKEPIKTGYKFIGWQINGGIYQKGEKIILNSDTTAYAQWEFIVITETFTITYHSNEPTTESVSLSFDANGGSGAPATITQISSNGRYVEFTIPQNIPTKTHSNPEKRYVFSYWLISGEDKYPGEIVRLNASATAVAYYNEYNKSNDDIIEIIPTDTVNTNDIEKYNDNHTLWWME